MPRWFTRRAFTTGALALLGARRSAAAVADFDPVSSERDVRAVLWSWTTAEQAAELRRDKVLFTRASSPTLGRGFLFDELARRDGKLARLLDGPRLEKGRYAWVNPWATCLGFASESYGTELLRIELKPTAWLAVMATSHEDLAVVDLQGKEVSEKAVLAAPERLAGVVFVNDRLRFTTGSLACDSTFVGSQGGAWREVYLGNVAQVARWSLGTAEIRKRLEDDRALLARFSTSKELPPATTACSSAWVYGVMRSRWTTPQTSRLGRYEASLAFLSDTYYPAAANVERLASELSKRLFTPSPLVVEP